MIFKVPEDSVITAVKYSARRQFKDFTRDELAQSVSYFLDLIKNTKGHIGIRFGLLSYRSIAFMLALIKSQRDYTIFYNLENLKIETLHKYCDHLFLVGVYDSKDNNTKLDEFNIEKIVYESEFCTSLWNAELEANITNHQGRDNLEIEFSRNQKIFTVNDNKKLTLPPAIIEEASVAAAMENYIDADDVCILMRPFKHIGVATLSIYPAIFKAKKVIVCSYFKDWLKVYEQGTNIHLAYEMIKEQWPLPKKARMITTGGYPFNSDCIKFVTDNCETTNIIDCYGTSFCPPPLAIRNLLEPNLQPFKWVNKFVKLVNRNDMLCLGAVDPSVFHDVTNQMDGELRTADRIENIDQDTFYFYGSIKEKFVRVNHVLKPKEDFEALAKEQTGLDIKVLYVVKEKDELPVPVIKVNKKDYKQVLEFIKQYEVEVSIEND